MKRSLIPCLAAAALVLAGCTAGRQQEEAGMVVGSIVGGLLGAQVGQGSGRTAATLLGTVVGAAVGGNVGRSMDENDRLRTAHALETVRTGVATQWRNPDTGHQYTVVPNRTYNAATGPCREYTVEAVVGGRPETVYGTACRQADGSWRVVN